MLAGDVHSDAVADQGRAGQEPDLQDQLLFQKPRLPVEAQPFLNASCATTRGLSVVVAGDVYSHAVADQGRARQESGLQDQRLF